MQSFGFDSPSNRGATCLPSGYFNRGVDRRGSPQRSTWPIHHQNTLRRFGITRDD
ncbi:MAG: hypothetical protein ACAF41_20880 [Leptolyngbya sp. BL-A-14]